MSKDGLGALLLLGKEPKDDEKEDDVDELELAAKAIRKALKREDDKALAEALVEFFDCFEDEPKEAKDEVEVDED